MLLELRVENLLLIERAELRLAPGLNVLTGETGAGKTILAHALDLLLGGRARSGIVRPGSAEAYVEGAWELDDELRRRLGDRLSEDAEELVLARRVSAEGRTRALVNGRTAGVGDLRQIGGELLAFYGQHEHRRLTLASAQLDILDTFCGAAQTERRGAYAGAYAAERELAAALDDLRGRAGARERELDLLRWELGEIEEAAPEPAEEDELAAERERLRRSEGLRAAALAGAESLAPATGEGGLVAGLAEAGRELEALEGVDPELDGLAERQRALRLEAEDLAAELRRYEEGVEAAPGRLEQVEERLAALERLKRKHGGTLAAVIEHADECRRRLGELEAVEESLERTEAELAAARSELDRLAEELREARRKAAPRLARAVAARLGELAMDGARFEVALPERTRRGPHGDEDVEFQLAPNPGVPAGPLREIASGGELSRVMLALMGVAAEAGPAAGAGLLVFDEVDAGIGGQTARAVGERLRALAATRQVLCITHLPQVASAASRHFTIAKDTGERVARATVAELHREDRLGELVRMLGADDDDRGARRHAQELLRAA